MADLFKYEEENLFKFEDGGDLFKYEDQPSQFKLDANQPVTGTLKSFVPESQPLVRESNVLNTKPIEPTIKNSPSTIYRSDNPLLNSVLGIPRALESGALQTAQAVTGAMYDVNPNAARERMRVLDERQQALRLAAGGQADYEQGAGSMAALAPLVAAGPGVMSVGAGLLAGGPAYQQAREKGIGPVGSAAYAAGQGGLEYATERIPLGIMFGQGGKGVIERFVKAMMPEITSEQIATLTQDALEQAVLNPEKSWDEYWNERGQAAVQTLKATVGGIGAAGAIMQAQKMLTPGQTKGEQFAQALQNEVNTTDLGAQNASQIQGPSEGMLRQERPQVGLQENGGTYAQPQEATREGQAQEVMFSKNDQINTDAFKKWSNNLPVVSIDDSKAIEFTPDNGVVVEALHGTTGDFTTFDKSYSNIESDLGGGFYFTNNKDDVSENYAGEGPDLTNKIQQRAEQIASETDREYDDPEVISEAKKQLAVEHGGMAMPVYIMFNNPVVLGGKRGTFLDFEVTYNEATDEYSEPTGKLVEFLDSLRNVSYDYGDVDIEQAISDVYEYAFDNGGIDASELIKKLSESEGVMYATDNDTGALASKEIIRRAFEDAGYDGFIDQTVNSKFGTERKTGQSMGGMDYGTVHYVAFNPDQIKSAIGNSGEFSTSDTNILRSVGSGKGMTVNEVITAITKKFGKKAGKLISEGRLRIVQSASDLPEWGRNQKGIGGAWDGKTAWIVADSMNPNKVIGAYLHEVGEHAGMRGIMGDNYQQLINRFNELLQEGDAIAVKADSRVPKDTRAGDVAQERIAYFIEEATKAQQANTLSEKAIRLLKDIISAIRAWVYRKFGGVKLNADDFVALAKHAANVWADTQQREQSDNSDVKFAIVWHGSPHKFDKFDMSKIGTGEGAQAYGHGLYFAEKKGVANEYKKNLSGDATIKKNGRNIATLQPNGTFTPLTTDDYLEASSLAVTEGNIDSAISNLNYEIGNTNNISFINRAKEAINNLKTQKYEYNGGSLYKVDIPDEAIPRMLDWDKPLSEQPDLVKKQLTQWVDTRRKEFRQDINNGILAEKAARAIQIQDAINGGRSMSGADAYHSISSGNGARADLATEDIKNLIPGIRYLDGGSRGAGTGTYNYVLFDDQLPRILERNGVPTGNKPWSEDNKVMFSKEDVDELAKKFAFAIKGQADSRIQTAAEKAFLDNQDMFERMKRGVVSVKDSEAAGDLLAKEVGWSPESIDQFIKDAGTQGVPPVEILAATMAMSRMQSLKLLEAQDPTEFLEYTADVLNTLMATRAYGSEMGRALQFIGAMERKGGYTPEQAKSQVPIAKKQAKQTADKAFDILKDKSVSHEDMKKALGGDKGIKKIMEAIKAQGKDIDLGMLVQYLSGVADGIIQAQKEDTTKVNSLMNMAMELFQANILTGVFTHEVNITSNLANMLMEFAFIQPVKGLVGGKKGIAGTLEGYKALGGYRNLLSDIWALMKYNAFEELPASRLSHLLAQRDPTMIALMRGSEGSKWNDTKRKYIPGKAGKIIRGYGFVPLGVEDAIFKVIPFRFELARQKGAGESQDIAKAIRFAEEMTFQSKSEFAATVSRFTSKHPSTKPWLLFIKTMTNIMKRITELTPVAGQIYNKKEIAGLEGKDAQQAAVARMIVGWSLAAMLWGLIDDGEDDGEIGIIGYGPSERRKEALWKKAGNEQVALRVGEDLYPFYRLDPVAGFIGLVAAEKKAATYTEAEKYDDAIVEIANGFYQAIMSKHFMVNVEETIGLMQDLIRYQKPQEEIEDEGKYKAPTPLDRVRRSMAKMGMSMVIPNIIPQIGDLTDEQKRKTRTIEDDILRKFPVLREQLPEMLDVSGQPMEEPRYHSPWPINKKHAPRDEVSRWMMKLGRTLESDPVRLRGLDKDVRKELLQRRWDNVTLAYELSKDMPKDIQKDNLESALRGWSRESGRIIMMEELNKE